MPQIRHLSTALVIAAATTLMVASVAVAHPGHHFGPRAFDDVWIDFRGIDYFEAEDGDRNKIIGLDGDDELHAGDRRDLVRGNTGNDTIYGGPGWDRLIGGYGDDTIYGGPGGDLIRGGYGADRIRGGNRPDIIYGGPDDDAIDGGRGRDLIRAGGGDDLIYAADGQRDWIRCGGGQDTVTADGTVSAPIDRIADSCETITWVPPAP